MPWSPLFCLIFYIMAPWPLSIARRYSDDMAGSSACAELALFLTTGIAVSAFGLPVVLAITHTVPPASLLPPCHPAILQRSLEDCPRE